MIIGQDVVIKHGNFVVVVATMSFKFLFVLCGFCVCVCVCVCVFALDDVMARAKLGMMSWAGDGRVVEAIQESVY